MTSRGGFDPAALVRRAATEAKERQQADIAQREVAPNILSPADVQGDYDAERLLKTTLGGMLREITQRDLEAFSHNAGAIGKRFKGGITVQGVINHSRREDRQRARKEIHFAVPARSAGGKIQFVTNAGPDSKVSRHFVTIELMGFAAAVSAPRTAGQAADAMTRGYVKFDCDCGRHAFWFRYIATIGRFNAGRAETGYPKVRNPRLTGVACKHVLRTMEAIREGQVRAYIAKMVERARQQIGTKPAPIAAADAKAILAAQGPGRARIKTSAEIRAARTAAAKAVAKARSINQAVAAKKRTTANRAQLHLQKLVQLGVISQKEAAVLLAKAKE